MLRSLGSTTVPLASRLARSIACGVCLMHAGCVASAPPKTPASARTHVRVEHHVPVENIRTRVDLSGARGMLDVVRAARASTARDWVRELDALLDGPAYALTFDRYNGPSRPRDAQAPREQFRAMVIATLEGTPFSTDYPRIESARQLFAQLVAAPEVYESALSHIEARHHEITSAAARRAAYWLPARAQLDAEVLVLVDPGISFGWVHENALGIDLMQLVDAQHRALDVDALIGLIAHELHHLGMRSILSAASEVQPISPQREWAGLVLYEGAATKLCNNVPTKLSPLANPSLAPAFLVTRGSTQRAIDVVWSEYMSDAVGIFARFRDDVARSQRSASVDGAYWLSNLAEGRGQGRNYYVGAEIVGVVLAAQGREGVLDLLEHPEQMFERYAASAKVLALAPGFALE